EVLPPGTRALTQISKSLPAISGAGISGWQTAVLRGTAMLERPGKLHALSQTNAQKRMGGLCQAPLWRPRARARLSRPIYTPRRSLQPPAQDFARSSSDFRLQGLQTTRPAKSHDALGFRVLKKAVATCSAGWFSTNTLLRFSCQSTTRRRLELVQRAFEFTR